MSVTAATAPKFKIDLMISHITLNCENEPERLPKNQLLTLLLIGTSFPMRELLYCTLDTTVQLSQWEKIICKYPRSSNWTHSSPQVCVSIQWILQTDVNTKCITPSLKKVHAMLLKKDGVIILLLQNNNSKTGLRAISSHNSKNLGRMLVKSSFTAGTGHFLQYWHHLSLSQTIIWGLFSPLTFKWKIVKI